MRPPCPIGPIRLHDHPTAEHLQIGVVCGHRVVVGRHYEEGQLGAFLPDGALVPDKIAAEMWVLGKLGGSKKNRVKARLMHGEVSEGLFYGSQGESWDPAWRAGDDAAEAFDIQ